MTSALIIDDHPMIHLGCSQILRDIGFDDVLLASTARDGVGLARDHRPELAILDLSLPDFGGLEAIALLREAAAEMKILVFSMNDRPVFAARALEAGAHGFLSKNAPASRFQEAAETVRNGDVHLDHDIAVKLASQRYAGGPDPLSSLTPREREVLFRLGDGLDLAAIAEQLEISYKTAANASSSLKRKLRARGVNDLIRIAIENKP